MSKKIFYILFAVMLIIIIVMTSVIISNYIYINKLENEKERYSREAMEYMQMANEYSWTISQLNEWTSRNLETIDMLEDFREYMNNRGGI